MFEIHGPTYRYQGERLRSPTIIYVKDHHYHTEHGYALQRLLDNSSCPADQHLLVFDHVNIQDEFAQYRHICLPLLLAAEAKEFNIICCDPVWPLVRPWAFNFMINKPRPHRLRVMDLIIENGLTSYRHSLCWQQGYREIPATAFAFGDEHQLDQGLLNGSHPNAETYENLLKNRVYAPTCVSVITEPAWQERETIITEKTIMAIWAGTVPIWAGGWRCADYMQSIGFDVFTDIVDHAYQYQMNPVTRIDRAIRDNLHLLRQPIDMTALVARLRHNLHLVQKNVWLQEINGVLAHHPALAAIVNAFRNGLLVGDC